MYDKEFKQIFDLAKGLVDDIEILLSSGKSFSVKIHKQEVESFNYADSKGIGIRIIKDGRVGYSYTEEFSEEAFKVIIQEAVDNSKYVENIEPVTLANYPDIDQKLDIYSDELDKVKVEDKIALAKRLEELAYAQDERVKNVPHVSYSDGYSYSRIANSKGLDKSTKANYAVSFVMVLVQEGEDTKSGSDFIITRDFNKLDPEKLAKTAVTEAVDLLNASAPASGQLPVVFNNDTMASLISTFSGVFSAKSAQEGRSLLKGRIGARIASDNVTLIDDGLHPDGMGTSPFDSEGFPSQKTSLIENGVLKSFLHNTITAAIDKTTSTGNGARSYKGSLVVAPSNLYLQQGEHTEADLFNAYDNVIEIVDLQGLHSGANPISGDFSLSAEGFQWEKGERVGGVSNFTVSGNFFRLLEDVEKIGNNFKFNTSSCGSPSVLVKRMSISSK
ncbi:MAG: TldD/PmbA family protein [Candidatus Cloacimonadia bacterium]